MSIGKVHVVLSLTLVAASCWAPTASNPPTATSPWVVSTLAGSGTEWFLDGTGSLAQFNNPNGVAVDSRNGIVYVADTDNNRIRKVTAGGTVSTLAGSGIGGWGSADGAGSSARFSNPFGVAVDSSGNVYVADYSNHRIRKVTAGGTVSTLAGSGSVWSGGFKDGPVSEARFNRPTGVAVDSSGNVYVADYYNHSIRKVVTAEDGTVTVSSLAGTGTEGLLDGPGRSAQFYYPIRVAVDSSGNVYVADESNHRIRKIVTAEDGTVTVSTLAGSGAAGWSGGGFADGPGRSAQFDRPSGVAVDSSGNVYVADTFNHRIRKVTAGGRVSTLAGSGKIWKGGFKDGFGNEAQFNRPAGVAVDSFGNIYVADNYNHRIRKMEYR